MSREQRKGGGHRKTILGARGGAVASARPDDKMGAEHPVAVGPWKGSWPAMMKKSARKKRRQRGAIEAAYEEE